MASDIQEMHRPPLPSESSSLVLQSRSVISNQTTSAASPAKSKAHLPPIVLSNRTFAAFWVLLVVLHGSCAAFLVACGQLYWYLEGPFMTYYADLLAPSESRHFKFVGTVLALLGAWNGIECLALVAASVRARRMAVPPVGIQDALFMLAKRYLISPIVSFLRTGQNPAVHPSADRLNDAKNRRSRVYMILEEGMDLLSIESERFDMIFTLREVVVVITQTVQCYTFSIRITRPWINHASVALVVTNCVSVAILNRILSHYDKFIRRASSRLATFSSPAWRASPAFARLLCHVLDCMLTFSISIVLPVAIFIPYYREFDPQDNSFPDSLQYSDTGFPNLVRENQALFARSWLDVGTKLVPHLSIYFCLVVIAGVLRTRLDPSHLSSPKAQPLHSSPAIAIERQSLVVRRDGQQPLITAPTSLQRPTRSNFVRLDVKTIKAMVQRYGVAALFLVLALVILTLHLQATMAESAGRWSGWSNDGGVELNLCAQAIFPWFAAGNSCAVIKYNCYRLGLASPPPDVFASLDVSTVSSVIFAHCSALVVPTSIGLFKNLLGFEIYNSTIVEWSSEAALTNTRHPDILFLTLAYVNMTKLPSAVYQTPFPEKLSDIELSKTNLSKVPDAAADSWRGVEVLYIEHSLFEEVPRLLLEIPVLTEFSMIGNRISTLPDDFSNAITTNDYYLLALSQNPLSALPAVLRSSLSFSYLSLEGTNISMLPDWVGERVGEVYLFGTPLCASTSSSLPNSTSSPSNGFLGVSDTAVTVGCSKRDDSSEGYYPLALTASFRSP